MKRMQWGKWLLGLVAALVMGVSAGEGGFRIFTAKDGRSIEARIVEYDANRGRIKIERRGKGVAWVKPGVFSQPDQEYIQAWAEASTFLVAGSFKVTAEKERVGKGGSKKDLLETERVRYDLTFQNRSKHPLLGLRVEYRYFLVSKGVGKVGDIVRVETGGLEVDSLKPSESQTLPTDTIALETVFGKQSESYTSANGVIRVDSSLVKKSEDEIMGLWVRVYGPQVEGESLVRDFTFPNDLDAKVSWDYSGSTFAEFVSIRAVAMSPPARQAWICEIIQRFLGAETPEEIEELSAGMELYFEKRGDGRNMVHFAVLCGSLGREDLYARWLRKWEVVEGRPQSMMRSAMLAEVYASSPDQAIQNGTLAEKYARTLTEREGRAESPADQDLLARAYARQGRFEKAAATQQKAVELLAGGYKKYYGKSFRARLELYQRGEAYTRGADDVALWSARIFVDAQRVFPATPGKLKGGPFFFRIRYQGRTTTP